MFSASRAQTALLTVGPPQLANLLNQLFAPHSECERLWLLLLTPVVPDRLRAAMQMLGALLQWERSPAPFGMVCGVRGTPRRDTDGPMRRRPFVLVRRHLEVRRPRSLPMLVDLRTNPRAACIDAGGFAMWGGLFSTFDCALLAIRQKDDPINPIMSGAITGGVLAARGQSAEPAV
jgi:hypothetical protein